MQSRQAILLSELQQQVKIALTERFALPVWVVAEVAELKVNYSGHCYLELVEKGASDGVPKAQARGVIWRSHYPRLAACFEAETGQHLAAGIKILVKATINYHELYGFSLQITDIDPAYTLGDMERRKQETIARLQQEGVWDLNRLLPLAPVVQRVAVISSRNAAGWQDFRRELESSPYRFEVELFDAFMQGEAAEDSIIAALYEVAERLEEFDVVVVIRGGGSTGDLSCFNAYRLCNHIVQFPLPVITGIGHDKDRSVADLVAHTPLKTPTAVAGWLVERMQQVAGWLETAALTLHDLALRLEREELLRLERLQGELKSRCEQLLQREQLRLGQLAERLPEEMERLLAAEHLRLDQASLLVESHSPERILKMGFSILRKEGRSIASREELQAGDRVEIELSDGRCTAKIEEI